LRVLLLKKRVTLAQAAPCLGWSLRTVLSIVTTWHRPKDAAAVAGALGYDVDELFPCAASRTERGPANRVKRSRSRGPQLVGGRGR
jgi:hypothetical protein